MSQPSSKVIIRQWKIIQFLLNNGYVTTADIEEYLYEQGLETAQRTIQRDLNLLEKYSL
ncbi:DeoR family transcriptional regulator [Acinetobacter junii]|uniref:DeoR family transcriptional regulator n=1 Tax=Acinetobacter junii TaxID=40215 RepID=UPI000A9DAEDA|nr:DeoR family transcriptional regulator [Acinetobacter junii]